MADNKKQLLLVSYTLYSGFFVRHRTGAVKVLTDAFLKAWPDGQGPDTRLWDDFLEALDATGVLKGINVQNTYSTKLQITGWTSIKNIPLNNEEAVVTKQ